jgi:hypothetical protein
VELFFHNGATGDTVQLTNSPTETPEFEGISGSSVFWSVYDAKTSQRTLYVYNGKSKKIEVLTRNFTANGGLEVNKAGSPDAYWTEGGDFLSAKSIFFYDGVTGKSTELAGSTTSSFARVVKIEEDGILWKNLDKNGSGSTLFFYNKANRQTKQLASYAAGFVVADSPSKIKGSNVFWSFQEAPEGSGAFKNFFYNGTTNKISQLPAELRPVDIYDMGGNNIVYKRFDGTDYELFLFNSTNGETIPLTGNVSNIVNESFVGVSDSTVFWLSREQLFTYNISTRERKLLGRFKVSSDDDDIQVDGSNIAWVGSIAPENSNVVMDRVFFYNGTTGQTAQLDTSKLEKLDGSNIISSASDLFFYNGLTGQMNQLNRNRAIFRAIRGSNIAWTEDGEGLTQKLFYSNSSFSGNDQFSFNITDGTNQVGGALTIKIN